MTDSAPAPPPALEASPSLPTRGRPAARAMLLALALPALLSSAVRAERPAVEDDPTSFSVRYRGHASPLRVNPLFVLPGESVSIEALPAPPDTGAATGGRSFTLRATGGSWTRSGPGRWEWTAPSSPGDHRLSLTSRGDTVAFHAFVLVPASEVRDGVLNGYEIGRYPESAFRGLDRYRPPAGFVEVTPENRDRLVSPHFRIGDFLCKQPAGWPRYVVVRERLLWKLEAVVDSLDRGGGSGRVHVMSGYRTPSYNEAIGQGRYSRHVYGDAADVFVDERPPHGRMDDLDGDGRVSRTDAVALHRLVESVTERRLPGRLVGGLSPYRSTDAHGPFVHVDARGYRARW